MSTTEYVYCHDDSAAPTLTLLNKSRGHGLTPRLLFVANSRREAVEIFGALSSAEHWGTSSFYIHSRAVDGARRSGVCVCETLPRYTGTADDAAAFVAAGYTVEDD